MLGGALMSRESEVQITGRASVLRATPAQLEALTVRQLEEMARTLRRKVDDDPSRYGGLRAKLDIAERSILDRRFSDAREQLAKVRQGMDEKDHQVGLRESLAEREKLGDLRNEPTATAATGAQTRDGWLWLKSKGRFSAARAQIGDHYREKHAKAQDPLRSCLNDQPGGSGQGASATFSFAKFELDGVRAHFRDSLGEEAGHALYDLLEAVVGRGETVRHLAAGNDRRADALVVELGFALDLTGKRFGMVRA